MRHLSGSGAPGQLPGGRHGHWLRAVGLCAALLTTALLWGSASIARADGSKGSGHFDPDDWWRGCFSCRQFMNYYPMQNYFPLMPQQYVALVPNYPPMPQYAPQTSTAVTISITFPKTVVSQPAVAAVSAPPPAPTTAPTPQPTPAPRPQPALQPQAPQPPVPQSPSAVQQAPAANPTVQGPGN